MRRKTTYILFILICFISVIFVSSSEEKKNSDKNPLDVIVPIQQKVQTGGFEQPSEQDISGDNAFLQSNAIDSLNGTTSLELTPKEKQWLVNHPEITITSAPDAPPINFFDANNRLSGIAADYLALIGEKLGIKFAVVNCGKFKKR